MACNDRLKDLALYAGGDLEKKAIAALEEHLARCESCRRELEELKSVLQLTSNFSLDIPGAGDFIEGVRDARARTSRRRALKFAAVAAVLLIAITFAIQFARDKGTDTHSSLDVAGVQQVEVESVGYDEAVVKIIPADNDSIAVVWIVSDEVETK
jgi:ferric-dicitrate binding protein FerR (iron transport regulator)